ncbi:hypothetical protein PR202_gb25544 [Eleusine coracana subsp. coracana]|uniref:Uncharacterized protein n=1 Tax=Eleusine coracana subsp. coracana TaxID=191504 RepID=A0AAV5FP87_ELECO|nr:hypothetical protein PR202_gb25544 [Eleusine coracana subsp. coracana]
MAYGTHAFHISGYSLHRGLGTGNFIQSAAFDVGGYSWCIRFYPDRYAIDGNDTRDDDMVATFLELLSENVKVRVHSDFRLVDHSTGLSTSVCSPAVPQLFDTTDDKEENSFVSGTDELMTRSDLQESVYLRDDRIVVECDVTVIKEPRVEEPVKVDVPPMDLSSDFGKLLGMEELADVVIVVKREVFNAHKAVLAVRCSILLDEAEVYHKSTISLEKKQPKCVIKIEDMQPATFKAFLHFIYTDSLPDTEYIINGCANLDVAKQLLVAADRYCMERLKLICEGILCESVDAKTVAGMLVLAYQHHCNNLRDACLRYINSSSRVGKAEASQPYQLLRRSLSAIFVDLREKAKELVRSSLFRSK